MKRFETLHIQEWTKMLSFGLTLEASPMFSFHTIPLLLKLVRNSCEFILLHAFSDHFYYLPRWLNEGKCSTLNKEEDHYTAHEYASTELWIINFAHEFIPWHSNTDIWKRILFMNYDVHIFDNAVIWLAIALSSQITLSGTWNRMGSSAKVENW